MSFFIRKQKSTASKASSLQKKKKNINGNIGKNRNGIGKFKTKKNALDEEILSDEFDEEDDDIKIDDDEKNDFGKKRKQLEDKKDDDESDNENETVQEKKIRLAKKYLAQLEQSEMFDDDKEGNEELDDVHRSNMISTHLKESVLEKIGKLHRTVADQYSLDCSKDIIFLKNGHRKTITAVAISPDGRFVFTASNDCNLIKWDINGKRLKTVYGDHRQNPEKFTNGHTGPIRALAISSDFKFLASGCTKKIIHIWCPDKLIHIHTFHGHRSAITGLVFRRSFHQLFSCSEDRMVKVWNLDEMSYVESLFGHHDSITAIDSFVRERCITGGGRDGTIRLWKIPEESNLIFLTGNAATIDCVKFIDESHFISASDDGSISLWAIFKKKPIQTIPKAHGADHWIISIASLRNTDLFASGSNDGRILFWKIKPEFKGIEKLPFEYNCKGFVNGLEFSQDGLNLVAALSQEHRLGRWFDRCKEARNIIHIIPLKQETEKLPSS